MTKDSSKQVLILGGYGEAGCYIAELLGTRFTGTITLAGRSLEKASNRAERFQQMSGQQADFRARGMDLSDARMAEEVPAGHDLILIACPLVPVSLDALIQGCIRFGADAIDIASQSGKASLFADHGKTIRNAQSRFVLGAGADPGLPGWLARYAASLTLDNRRLTLWGRYRSTQIGREGASDILDEAASQGWQYRKGWRRTPWGHLRTHRFKGNLGRAVCVPIRLAELETLPETLDLDQFSFYHAGMNPVTDAMMVLERFNFLKPIPKTKRHEFFFNAMHRFSRPPFGLALEAEFTHGGKPRTIALCHEHLYKATAAPTVIMAEWLLANPAVPADYGYLGFWATQHTDFLNALESLGFQFHDDKAC